MATKAKSDTSNRSLLNLSIKEFVDDYVYRIDLDADYQREKIWTSKQQELLLDSILNDIDIPKIYLAEAKDPEQFDYECVDGKQRITTLLRFYKPDKEDKSPLKVRHYQKEYSYKEFKKAHPSDAAKIDNYEVSICVYKPLDDEFVREIFRRLQLGIRLNSGELLKSRTGTIRDFVYSEIGNNGPFFRKTNLSEKRYSRPFTLTQICLNSFSRAKTGEFVRARLQDIEDFFEDNHDLDRNDENLVRIKKVLKLMDKAFGKGAGFISSRAVAVSAYLFVEDLLERGEPNLVLKFSQFYLKLLESIKENMELLSDYKKPKNTILMEEFQKYVLQASVESYSVKRRHDFLEKAFDYFQDSRTKGKIFGD